MRLILSLALLLACPAGLHGQARAAEPGAEFQAAASALEARSVDSEPTPAASPTAAEQSVAAEETTAARTAPIFDREFVRHVAAMVIAAVLTTLILRAIF